MSRANGLERLHELLADRAGGEPETARTRDEVDRLLAAHPDVEEASFERAAAAAHLALLGPSEPLPAALRRRIEHQAALGFGWEVPPRGRPGPRPFLAPWLGWIVAAAACLLLALQVVAGGPDGAFSPEAISGAADALALDWQRTADPGASGATGGVVWSNALQAGYMRFRGLPPNDSAEGQYQLWIFDADRPAEYPIDGGVFDADGGEDIVPIDARLSVVEPTLFAITYERPGGVVVSTRERLLLTAGVE